MAASGTLLFLFALIVICSAKPHYKKRYEKDEESNEPLRKLAGYSSRWQIPGVVPSPKRSHSSRWAIPGVVPASKRSHSSRWAIPGVVPASKRSFCRELDESCRGFPRCCGDTTCYWEDGWSAITAGVCVNCIEDGQKCQHDAQCCSELVCQKASMYDIDGTCAAKLANGAECHDNDQCQSEYCDISWQQDVAGSGGRCADREDF